MDSHFTGFLASLLLAILVQQERITPLLSAWQVFLVFLDFLGTRTSLPSRQGKTDWDHDVLHFHSEASSSPVDCDASSSPVDCDAECVRIVDDSFGYCASYRLEREVMQEVSAKARRDLERIRGVYDCMLLPSLFTTTTWNELQYDLTLKWVWRCVVRTRLELADLEKEPLYKALNYPMYLTAHRDILQWVRRALGKRAVTIRGVFQNGLQWSINEVRFRRACDA